MGRIILRVDDRGVHSQVLIGWVLRLGIKRVILCVEEKRKKTPTPYSLPLSDVSFSLLTPEEILKNKPLLLRRKEKTLIVSPSLAQAHALLKGSLGTKELIIGGLHYKKGRKHFLDFVYLGKQDISYIRRILSLGVFVFAQKLPDSPRYDLQGLLRIRP